MKRITYIDSAKGISILLIVSMHLGIAEPWPYAYDFMVAIFFILSGVFFRPNLSCKEFLKKKFYSLIMPFIIFWVISYSIFYLLKIYAPGLPTANAKGILDCFTQHEFFNGPLWFLPCLFFVQIVSWFLYRRIQDRYVRFLCIIAIGLLGYNLGVHRIYLPLGLDISLVALVFFCIGFEFNKFDIIENMSIYKLILLFLLLTWISWSEDVSMGMSINKYESPFMSTISAITMMSYGLIIVCVVISKYFNFLDEFFSLIGKNSLWILCTHHLIYRPIKMFLPNTSYSCYIIFVITIIVCLASAPYVERFMPIMVGKRK